MNRTLTARALGLAGVVLAAAWLFSTPSTDHLGAENPASFDPEVRSNALLSPAPHTTGAALPRVSFGFQSPFGSVQSALPLADPAAPGYERSRQQFVELLQKYRSGGISPDEKILIKKNLRELRQDPMGRSLIIETFFSNDEPQLAEDLYALIRDADLKDLALLEGMIQRDNTKLSTTAKTRILDLIADLSAKDDAPYSGLIDGYLAQVALNPDTQLRNTAASQRIWYLAHHQSNNLAVLANYLFDNATTVREEMHSLIESRIASQTLSGQAELVVALNTALQANRLGVSAEEKARVTALLRTLTDTVATF